MAVGVHGHPCPGVCLKQWRCGCRWQSVSSSHACPGAAGAFPPPLAQKSSWRSCSSPQAPEQWPLSPLLRDGDRHRGIKGQWECRQLGSGARCWGGTREGGTCSAQAPQHSSFSATLCWQGAQRQQANQQPLCAPESRVPGGTGSPQGRCEHAFPFKTLAFRARA